MAALTQRLFGRVRILADIEPAPHLHGIGMSDAPCYSDWLARKFDYTNTFFHCEPLLDITAPQDRWLGQQDFIITSDVFEHVAPPVQKAFDNLNRLLKPGGVVVFSVPYSTEGETREHYPDLHRFDIREEKPGCWILENRTLDGRAQRFTDLIFHGGPGTTLEMRLFSLSALQAHFVAAGFVDFQVHNEPLLEHGVFWPHPWSITISALRATC